jgi:hypothetical protein
LVKVLDPGSSSMSSFFFSPPSKDLLQKGINNPEKNVFYNWTEMSWMSMSRIKKPFQVVREFHPLTFQALLEVCSKVRSFVVN